MSTLPLVQPDADDLPHTEWKCEACGATNSCLDGDCQFCEPQPAKPPFYTVAIYLEDRAYGGPEEGGWWYDCGQRVDDPAEHGCSDVPKLFGADDFDEAREFCRGVNASLDADVNKGRPSTGSVLSQGRYVARVCDGYPDECFPKERPQYS